MVTVLVCSETWLCVCICLGWDASDGAPGLMSARWVHSPRATCHLVMFLLEEKDAEGLDDKGRGHL